MKNRKRILCSGLAFSDKEDMEMLHQYALDGWIFREFKGLSYILHKEEPQDLIFSYDFSPVPPEEREEYLTVFKDAGWHPIASNYSGYYFFWAKNGTVPVHTDQKIEGENFRKVARGSLATCLISAIALFLAHFLIPDTFEALRLIAIILTVALLAGSAVCFVGCYLRTKSKRLSADISFKNNSIIFILSAISLVGLAYLVPAEVKDSYPLIKVLYGLCGAGIGGSLVTLIFKYPLYRDGKVK